MNFSKAQTWNFIFIFFPRTFKRVFSMDFFNVQFVIFQEIWIFFKRICIFPNFPFSQNAPTLYHNFLIWLFTPSHHVSPHHYYYQHCFLSGTSEQNNFLFLHFCQCSLFFFSLSLFLSIISFYQSTKLMQQKYDTASYAGFDCSQIDHIE